MKQYLLLILFFSSLSFLPNASAQSDIGIGHLGRAETIEVEGTMYTKKGEEKPVLLKIKNPEDSSSKNQGKIKYKLLKNRDKKKWAKLKPGSATAYSFNLDGKDYYYESIKYRNSSELSIGMLKSQYFVLRHVSGPVSIYQFFNDAEAYCLGKADCAESEQGEEDRKRGNYLISKDSGKVKAVTNVPLKSYFEDCSSLMEKWEAGEYGAKPPTKSKNSVTSFVKRTLNSNMYNSEKIVRLAEDYNNCKA